VTLFVLTSSRADYGIYRPLLMKLKDDREFRTEIVAFGTHLSPKHGKTVREIKKDGFAVRHKLKTAPKHDGPADISRAIANTVALFSEFWKSHAKSADLIVALGDRYEMFAAVTASVPFGLKVAHIHGGETTHGAIDDAFRHSITHMASMHFASTEGHARRVKELKNSSKGVFNVGSLSLDNLRQVGLLSPDVFEKKYGIPLNKPVLVTFHPETVGYEKNGHYVNELIAALHELKGDILITMPNADTKSDVIRRGLTAFAKKRKDTYVVESLGTLGYFTAMKHCRYMIGNSSSGIIEAASFGKYVIDIGKRQQGREAGANVIHCEINRRKIVAQARLIEQKPALTKKNIYGDGKTAEKIVGQLRRYKSGIHGES
jgi:GDP/UDP-N,N'-diacetylbacillosamine 2-epimerase (hydrolysing)